MNRLLSLGPSSIVSAPTPPPAAPQVARAVATRGGGPACEAYFAPLHYEPNYGYPLLVWLHGAQGSEQQLRRVAPLISMRNYVAAAPRGLPLSESGQDGLGWPQDEDAIELAAARVADCIAGARDRFNVNGRRVFLAGYESGGAMALRLAFREPERFAGVLSLCGGIPQDGQPLARLHQVRRLPLFLAHGRFATDYGEEQACRDLRLVHSAGIVVTLRQYPCGDEVTTQMLSDMNNWMMEIVTGMPTDGEA